MVVWIHELGHFLAAKASGVRVETFSIGFPPKLLRWKGKETEYVVGAIPLGGYVKLSGMSDESLTSAELDDPRGFARQPFSRKLFIITAGVLMNFALGWGLYSFITYWEGVSQLVGTKITLVSPDFPAAEAGIKVGDQIVEVDGQPITRWEEMVEIVRKSPGRPLKVLFQRNDSLLSAEVIPKAVAEFNLTTGKVDTVGKIGVVGTWQSRPVDPWQAIGYGAQQVAWVLRLNVLSLRALITGRAGLRELTGPLGIARMSEQSARAGGIAFLSFIALISVSIGFLNILPVPMLDGGHLAFIGVEAVTRRRIPEKVKLNLIRIGFALLIALVIMVSYYDIVRFYLSSQ